MKRLLVALLAAASGACGQPCRTLPATAAAGGRPGREGPKEDRGPGAAGPCRGHPLAGVSDAELERRLLEDRAALGPVSLGQPDAGLLWNGVQLSESDRWTRVDPSRAFGTPETLRYLAAAVDEVHERFPGTRKLFVGAISREGGGRLGRHRSHQSGRDVDIGLYFEKRDVRWSTAGTEENLDLPRTWALLRALVTETDLELVVLDRDIQWLLRSHAVAKGEDRAWVRSLFVENGPGEPALVQHDGGHRTHLHVRFHSPVAQQTGHRVYPLAVKNGLFAARHHFVAGWAKRGESREGFLARHRLSLASFRKANGPRADRFQPGRSYRIPRRGPVDPGEGPPVLPPRRLPPGAPVDD